MRNKNFSFTGRGEDATDRVGSEVTRCDGNKNLESRKFRNPKGCHVATCEAYLTIGSKLEYPYGTNILSGNLTIQN